MPFNYKQSLFLLLLIFTTLSFTGVALAEAPKEYRINPAHVEGPDECGECHKETVKAWKASHHATTFKEMPRSEEARKIAEKMGIKRIKSDSTCLNCHFTMAADDASAKIKPIAGISCESCHSAGKEWIDVHSDYGGKDVKAENEDPAHKVKRYMESEMAGMIRPSNAYALAANCYGCHTVPNEKLVNVGGHTAGSKFELVRWSQGEVRHNVWYSDDNTEADLERRRLLYIVGKMLDLEYAVRGVAIATEKKEYALAMAKRAKRALAFLKKIDETVDDASLTQLIQTASGAKLKLNNKASLLAVAEKLSQQANTFADNNDGKLLAGVDALLPASDKYKGDVFKP